MLQRTLLHWQASAQGSSRLAKISLQIASQLPAARARACLGEWRTGVRTKRHLGLVRHDVEALHVHGLCSGAFRRWTTAWTRQKRTMRKIGKRQRWSTQACKAQTLEAWLQCTQHTQYLTEVETHLHKGWAAHTATRAFSIWKARFDSKEWLLVAHARCRQRLREHAVLDRALASWNTLQRPRNTHTQAAYVGDQRQRRRTRWMTEVWRVWQTCRAEQADAAARDINHELTLSPQQLAA